MVGAESPAIALPGPPHLPGRTPRPPEVAFAPLKEALGEHVAPSEIKDCAAFRCAQRLFLNRYYWEAHELFEAVWIRLPPASAERHLLRGLIQLANAGLKHRLGRPAAARRILTLADAALAEAAHRRAGGFPAGLADFVPAFREQAETESMAR